MKNKEIVKLINDSDILGTFIEVGAGQPVAQEIFQIDGASKTIYKSYSPYSKKEQEGIYSTEKIRSVSKEFVQKVIKVEMGIGHWEVDHNTFFVSSFQIANKPGMLTHGWIGLRYRGEEKYYHITITEQTEREKIIALIGSIGLRILYCKNDLTTLTKLFSSESAMFSCIDIITSETSDYLGETLQNLQSGGEHPITISKTGKLIRLEELTRQGDLILMKGSFNPIHNYHLELMKTTEEYCKGATPCFGICLHTYSKDVVDFKTLSQRIKMINELGYPVIVFQRGLFSQNISYLRHNRHFNQTIILPLGSDTANRLIESSYSAFKELKNRLNFYTDFDNVLFPYLERPGYELNKEYKVSLFKELGVETSINSSTLVRELFLKGDYNEIKKIVPVTVYESIINYLKQTIKK